MAAFGRVGFSGSVPDLDSKRGKSTCLKRARDFGFRACLPPPFLTLGVEINSQKRIDIAVVAPSKINQVMTSQESKVEALKDTISRLHVSLHSMSRRHTGREELVRELVEATKELKGLGWEVTSPDKATGVVNYYPASHLGRLEGILSGSIQDDRVLPPGATG